MSKKTAPNCILVIFLSLICLISGRAQVLKSEYLHYLKLAAEKGWSDNPRVIEEWKKNPKYFELFGYLAPGSSIYLADLLGYLYQQTGDKAYAEKAADLLVQCAELGETYAKEHQNKRIEYRDGVPAITDFFVMPAYSRAYLRIRPSGALDAGKRAKLERDLAFSLDFIFHFPEWGAHNRAMLRAESLYYGATALADHPHAKRWKQLAETLASDNLKQWEIEDATGYHAIWLYSLFSYADISGRMDALLSPQVKYYLDYYIQLLTPHGNVADFGDAHWNDGNLHRFVPVYEKAAAIYRNPQYKFMAQELMRRGIERAAKLQKIDPQEVNLGIGVGWAYTDAHRWADDAIKPVAPTNLSGEALDDLIGKKMVFRNGWERNSTMMLLNYRDEGDGGKLGRDFLRQTLSVEEEKMHHGHADENSIALLMSGRSVLLHDGGYRPDLPSGQYGAWRADYFHNRVVARKNKRDKTQDLYEFIRNAGAYRRVRTQKIDFLNFKDVDVSRTRVIDDELGYQWDRVVSYVKAQDFFVVIDGIKALRSDYFTFTNLWHTRQLTKRDPQTFETSIDKIGTDILPDNKSLLIHFPENSSGKQIGTFPISRHFQDETAIYQTISSFYNAGDCEYFVTILIPRAKNQDERAPLPQLTLLNVDRVGKGVGLEIRTSGETLAICVKLDLEMDLARENIRPRYVYELGKIKYGSFETDASYLFAVIKSDQIAYSAATMTKILYRNQTLMEALPNTFGLQLDGEPPRTGYARWRFWEDEVKIK